MVTAIYSLYGIWKFSYFFFRSWMTITMTIQVQKMWKAYLDTNKTKNDDDEDDDAKNWAYSKSRTCIQVGN